MTNKLFLWFCIFFSTLAIASDYGTTGLIDIPSARMSSDGFLTATSANSSKTNSYALTYQATPWLETSFRYTGFLDPINDYDRNYEVKMLLLEERDNLPQIAVGIRDLVGTGLWGSEYIVANKKIENFDFTVGLGWGRLAGEGDMKNPLIYLSESFSMRKPSAAGGGQFPIDMFFRGQKVGLFGGLSYTSESYPLTMMLEYNPDSYKYEISRGDVGPKSPLSVGLKWDLVPGMSITISRQHRQDWAMEVSSALDTKLLPSKTKSPFYRSSLDFAPEDLPKGIKKSSWYDTLLFDAERSGLLLLEATINELGNSATIVMGNMSYPVWTDAVGLMAKLADLHLPIPISIFNIVIEEEGHRVNSIRMRRPSLNFGKNKNLLEREVRIEPVRKVHFVQHRTNFATKKILLDVNLSTRVQLFDPEDPARYQLYAKINLSTMLPGNVVLSGAIDKDITNNFDEIRRKSDSVLTRVRSDIAKYLIEGESGVNSLFIQKRGNLNSDIFYRAFAGVLESMYSGLGGEILYQPFQSRFALGFSANWVKQRDFARTFKHLEYETETAFLSAYWASPFHNFDIAIHAGRYLAEDIGATLEVRRTFDNGWMVGLWATKTDVSSKDFGEGSFDKGLFFKIPFSGVFGSNSRTSFTTRIRPIQRDGGQYLEDFTGRIWWDIRSARYDAFSHSVSRIIK